MMCPSCGTASTILPAETFDAGLRVTRWRTCHLGHKFLTAEVHLSQLADARELRCAQRNIERRIARFERNVAISIDERPARQVAAQHKITETRVRQIRAAMREIPPSP